ncbi:MAG TPA: CpsB/CapC family capsule biosynthesis tyrosine phosphatase, partial [Ferruginibacter sp.]|nr:CpsB/CapC family capsule biosynthesis tyrosine phosphatase [Ferruginibacter sp.]
MSLLDLFKKKQPIVPGYFPISTDMHSHILPGIDDGSPDVETSIELVKGLMQLGINRSIATPHVISDLYRNTPETIGNALKILQDELAAQQINFTVSAAAEYMLDPYFFELMESGERLLTLQDNIILTEFSFGFQPDNPKKMSFAIITQGYTPILAHPERYAYFHRDFKVYHLLQDMGFLLQVNLLSLTGYYGAPVAKAARYIIKNGLASYTGTDLHHARHMAA